MKIRTNAVMHGVPCVTTLAGASAAVIGIQAIKKHGVDVKALQDYFSPSQKSLSSVGEKSTL